MILTKDQQLQASLKAGDIIIATEIDYFDYNEEIKEKMLYSQQPGDLLMVNNTHVTRNEEGDIIHISDCVGGVSLNGTSYNGRECLGLGGSLTVGKFRLATPDDLGYMATRDAFQAHDNQKVKQLQQQLLSLRVVGSVAFLMGLWVFAASVGV